MEREELDMVSTPFDDKKYYENIRRALCAGFFMQVAKKESQGKSVYTTIKDNQSVLLHPSTVLAHDAEWVLYNEFVLTTKNYIRTVVAIKPEWLLVRSVFSIHHYLHLLTPKQDIAPTYYDVNSFPKGDIRSSLQRAADRLARKEKMRSERR
jgi:pre-mRNA-splicing factor ATP-dependent RNA helicase DHX15/PRP43